MWNQTTTTVSGFFCAASSAQITWQISLEYWVIWVVAGADDEVMLPGPNPG
jgi:hypothetical protein